MGMVDRSTGEDGFASPLTGGWAAVAAMGAGIRGVKV
jgi:hypothetical protein